MELRDLFFAKSLSRGREIDTLLLVAALAVSATLLGAVLSGLVGVVFDASQLVLKVTVFCGAFAVSVLYLFTYRYGVLIAVCAAFSVGFFAEGLRVAFSGHPHEGISTAILFFGIFLRLYSEGPKREKPNLDWRS